jgi:hypothetical protein
MSRPPLEVADLIRAAGEAFIERNRHWMRWKHVKVLRAIARCRTAALGGHLDECTRCGHRAISFNNCRAAYRCSNPTSLSAGGHRCSMKALSVIRILRVPRRGSHLSALPSDSPLFSPSSTISYTTLFRRNQLLHPRCHVVHPRARPWPTFTPFLPIIEFP